MLSHLVMTLYSMHLCGLSGKITSLISLSLTPILPLLYTCSAFICLFLMYSMPIPFIWRCHQHSSTASLLLFLYVKKWPCYICSISFQHFPWVLCLLWLQIKKRALNCLLCIRCECMYLYYYWMLHQGCLTITYICKTLRETASSVSACKPTLNWLFLCNVSK